MDTQTIPLFTHRLDPMSLFFSLSLPNASMTRIIQNSLSLLFKSRRPVARRTHGQHEHTHASYITQAHVAIKIVQGLVKMRDSRCLSDYIRLIWSWHLSTGLLILC